MMGQRERAPEKGRRIWKLLFCIFMASAVTGAAMACMQAGRQNRATAELERLAEGTYTEISGGPGATAEARDNAGISAERPENTGIFVEAPDNAGIFVEAPDNAGISAEAPGSAGISAEVPGSTGVPIETSENAGALTEAAQGTGACPAVGAKVVFGLASALGIEVRYAASGDGYIQALRDRGIPIPEKEIDFSELQEKVNGDIYAWIYLPDTKIDYPVLQHATDNYYYLNYNLDGSRGYPGCIYTEDYNAKDFSDPNTVIYGHNMKNGSMFAGLHLFEDSEYFEAHPYVYIYTEEGLFVYEIFAAYESGNEHILYNNDFTDPYVFAKYVSAIFNGRTMNGNIREEAEIASDDRILTLSTCVANKSDRRYLVQAVLLEGESGTADTGEADPGETR